MNEEHELIEAVVKAYLENRPAGLPDTVAIVPAMRTGERERPCVLVSTVEGTWRHPRLFQCELVMELLGRKTDVQTEGTVVPAEDEPDDGGAATFSAWLGAIFDAMLPLLPAIKTALQEKGLKLTYVYPGSPAEEPNGEDGYEGERRWVVRVEKVLG